MFSDQEAHLTFYKQVLLSVVRLANTMRMSTSDYDFSIPGSPVTLFKPVTTDLLETHKMVVLVHDLIECKKDAFLLWKNKPIYPGAAKQNQPSILGDP